MALNLAADQADQGADIGRELAEIFSDSDSLGDDLFEGLDVDVLHGNAQVQPLPSLTGDLFGASPDAIPRLPNAVVSSSSVASGAASAADASATENVIAELMRQEIVPYVSSVHGATHDDLTSMMTSMSIRSDPGHEVFYILALNHMLEAHAPIRLPPARYSTNTDHRSGLNPHSFIGLTNPDKAGLWKVAASGTFAGLMFKGSFQIQYKTGCEFFDCRIPAGSLNQTLKKGTTFSIFNPTLLLLGNAATKNSIVDIVRIVNEANEQGGSNERILLQDPGLNLRFTAKFKQKLAAAGHDLAGSGPPPMFLVLYSMNKKVSPVDMIYLFDAANALVDPTAIDTCVKIDATSRQVDPSALLLSDMSSKLLKNLRARVDQAMNTPEIFEFFSKGVCSITQSDEYLMTEDDHKLVLKIGAVMKIALLDFSRVKGTVSDVWSKATHSMSAVVNSMISSFPSRKRAIEELRSEVLQNQLTLASSELEKCRQELQNVKDAQVAELIKPGTTSEDFKELAKQLSDNAQHLEDRERAMAEREEAMKEQNEIISALSSKHQITIERLSNLATVKDEQQQKINLLQEQIQTMREKNEEDKERVKEEREKKRLRAGRQQQARA